MNDSLDLKRTFTTGDIAHLLGVASRTVAQMVDRGDIKGFQLPSGDRRIPRENLIQYLKKIKHESALRDIGE